MARSSLSTTWTASRTRSTGARNSPRAATFLVGDSHMPRLAALVLLLFAAPAFADDWPQWLGPKRDGVWRETGIIEKFPDGGPVVRWRAPVVAGYAGPAVSDGRVFVMDRVLAEGAKNHPEPFPQRPRVGIPGIERVLCSTKVDGKLLWKHESDCHSMVSYPLAPRGTPTVSGGKVYALGPKAT